MTAHLRENRRLEPPYVGAHLNSCNYFARRFATDVPRGPGREGRPLPPLAGVLTLPPVALLPTLPTLAPRTPRTPLSCRGPLPALAPLASLCLRTDSTVLGRGLATRTIGQPSYPNALRISHDTRPSPSGSFVAQYSGGRGHGICSISLCRQLRAVDILRTA